jgi:type II secretion system protein N
VREHLRTVGYATFGVAAFVIALAVTFPYAATLSALLRPLDVSLSSSGQSISLPLGASLSDVRLVSTQPASQFEVDSPYVTLAPTLGGLLLGQPGVRAHAQLYGGALRATVYRRSREIEVSFSLDHMALERLAALRATGAEVLGRLSGWGRAQLAANDPMAASGEIEFQTADLTISVARGVAPIRLGKVEGTLTLDRGALNITQLNGHGPDGVIDGRGSLMLGPDARRSSLDLRIIIEPSAEGRARLGMFFGLLPHPPGPKPYILTGPLLNPSIS